MIDGESRSGSHDTARRFLIRLFIGSVALNAVLGTVALLSGDFGQTEGKVLATSFLVSGAMLSVLVNSTAIALRVVRPVPAFAAGALVFGLLLLIVAMWAEVDNDWMPKTIVSALMIGGVGTLVGLVALGVEPGSMLVLRSLHGLFLGAALGMGLVMLWTERASDPAGRILGVECVIAAALTLVIPVLSRSRHPLGVPGVGGAGADSYGFCPICGASLGGTVSWDVAQECDRCGAFFRVRRTRSPGRR